MGILVEKNLAWVYYRNGSSELTRGKTGKWYYYFSDYQKAEKLCKYAVENNIVKVAKHSNKKEGMAFFYLSIDDVLRHKKVINFFLENNMIRRTKSGKLYNISFKLDEQTRAGEYGDDYKPELKLDELMDLETEEWLV